MKPCRKCLLSETDQAAFFATIQEFIDSIPAEEKTPEDEYQRRLEICKACDHLTSGMCALCGCYVEVRAAKANQQCVQSDKIWRRSL
ncbi:MAG: DUF6171 family protein [Defluviitaleaceae bacterium]|nr:DUF6171 family protein [Defluviitaleaceae bacterium]